MSAAPDPAAADGQLVTIDAAELARLRRIEALATKWARLHRAFWRSTNGAPARIVAARAERELLDAVGQ